MFTGIVQNVGIVKKLKPVQEGLRILISTKLPQKDLKRGSSILVEGVCLTVEKYSASKKIFQVTLVHETLRRTYFSQIKVGRKVNLEPSFRLGDAFHGHFVLGHTDFRALVLKEAPFLKFKIPPSYTRYFPQKGSLCINGVSLTLAYKRKDVLGVALIPETLKKTNLALLRKGDFINIEIDVLIRYLESLNPKR